jgi:hypothetical protein
LLDVTNHVIPPRVGVAVDREEGGRGKTGAVIEQLTTGAFDPLRAQEVALAAEVHPQCGLEMLGIDDRRVVAVDQFRSARVELPGAVAPLATDRVALEDRLPVSIRRPLNRLDAVGMTEEAPRLDRPVEVEVVVFIARRGGPASVQTVPRNGRLVEPTVVFDEV